jgi:hypothetical protein
VAIKGDKALTPALDAPTSHPYLLTAFEFFHASATYCIRPVINRPYNITWVFFPPPAPSSRCLPPLLPSFLPSSRSGTICLSFIGSTFFQLAPSPGSRLSVVSTLPPPPPHPTPPYPTPPPEQRDICSWQRIRCRARGVLRCWFYFGDCDDASRVV